MSGTPSRMSGSSQETLRNLREWSGCPPGCPELVGRAFRMSRTGRETLLNVRYALPDVRELSRDPMGVAGVVGMAF